MREQLAGELWVMVIAFAVVIIVCAYVLIKYRKLK